jgi:hypothetical protein
MSNVISGLLVVATFLVAMLILGGMLVNSASTQAQALQIAAKMAGIKARTAINIGSITVVDLGNTSQLTAPVENQGTESISEIEKMDVIVRYTDINNLVVTQRLTYVSGTPGDNQWTLSSLSPDSLNPNIWDPDETATLTMVLAPEAQSGVSGTLVIATPNGITDSAYFTP